MDRLIFDAGSTEDGILARLEVEKTARELGMRQAPPVKFFHPSDEDRKRGLMGFYKFGVIHLSCRLSQKDLLDTVRHEVRHCWQDSRPEYRKLSSEAHERDAFLFERYS